MTSNFNKYLLIAALACLPVFFVSLSYMKTTHQPDDEPMAVAATICFFGFVYMGRYLAISFADTFSRVSNLIGILSILIAANTIWLFVHADFPMRHKPALNMLLSLIPFIVLCLSIGMMIKLMRVNQQQLKEANLSATHSRSELQLLQSQLSPHFLFNTLNNLYGISISQHEKMPNLLLKLSELLRYSVYEAKEMYVPLRDEINYIENYIDFEKIRIGDRLKINSVMKDIDGDIQIAPMILIVFIENAFKHAKNSTDENIYIDIELKTWSTSILFSVKNSYQANGNSKSPDKYSGFGLSNVEKRLELMYQHHYDLKTEIKEDSYCVMLQLKTE